MPRFFPERGGGNSQFLVQIGGVIQQVEGQRFIGGIAGFGQQFFRFFVTFFLRPGKPFRLGQFRAIGIRRGVAVGRQIALFSLY
jgi:hypothetical protein